MTTATIRPVQVDGACPPPAGWHTAVVSGAIVVIASAVLAAAMAVTIASSSVQSGPGDLPQPQPIAHPTPAAGF